MRRLLLLTLAMVALAACATPQGQSGAMPASSAARAIAAFPAVAAYWEVTPQGGMRHIKSGLDCGAPQHGGWTLVLLNAAPMLPPGDDAFCTFRRADGAFYTLYATRAPGTQQAEEMRTVTAAIQQAIGPLRKGLGITVVMREGLPLAKAIAWMDSAGFVATLPGHGNVSTTVRLALVGDWVVKMRTTSAGDGLAPGQKPGEGDAARFVAAATLLESEASQLYLNALNSVAQRQKLVP